MEQRGADVAVVCSGELQGSAAVLHTKIKWEGLEVRHGMGKRMENTGGAERLTRAGKESKRVAGKRSSGVELLRLGGTRERETRGEWTGEGVGIYRTKYGRGQGFNRRIMAWARRRFFRA